MKPKTDHTALLAELYQVLGALNAPERVLDQVFAAANGEPLPHASLLPFLTPDEPEPSVWQPIDTAPLDNLRPLYLARFNEQGEMVEIDFDGVWEYWQESWELPHINGWSWCSANGIEEPTHWAYQTAGGVTLPPPAGSASPLQLPEELG